MTQILWCAVLGVGGLLGDGAAAPPDLADYRSPKDARTREIVPPRGGRGGETGYLGVSVHREGEGRLVVDEVQSGSPAAEAGVRAGDVLRRVGGEAVKTPEALRESLQGRAPGVAVELVFTREDQPMVRSATLAATSRPRTIGARRPYLGVMLGEAEPGQGVPVEAVAPDSPAATVGFEPGDLIFRVEGADVGSPTRLLDILNEKRPGDDVEVAIRRGEAEVVLRPRLASESGGAPGAPRPGGEGNNGVAARSAGANAAPELWKQPAFRLAVVGIEFPDVKHNDKVGAADWHEALLSDGSYRDKEGPDGSKIHGSLNDYFREQSGGRFRLEGKVFDWVEVGKKRAEYVLGSGTTNITAVLVEALGKIVERDGKDAFEGVDGFLFLYAGAQVPGNRGGVYYPHAGLIRNFQSRRWPYVLAPEGGPNPTPIGGLAKECGQMLGLPDLAARPENRGSEGLGGWCLLSTPSKSSRPQHLGAWAKEKLGWARPAVIDPTVPQKLVLAPIEDAPDECFKVLVRLDGSEYFLLENRRKKGFDSGLPGEGLLIWRVVQDRPILEESHGVEGPAGPTAHMAEVPYPSEANHAFTPETTPSSRSPLGGGLPVSITNIRRLDDGRITFHIGAEYR